jgi:hypothetical protein
MFEWSRQRRSQRRFIEIRHENLILDPKKTLHPIFSAAGVGWNDECLGALSRPYVKSPRASPFAPAPPLTRKQLRRIVAQVDDLAKYLDELGYELPASFSQEMTASSVEKRFWARKLAKFRR